MEAIYNFDHAVFQFVQKYIWNESILHPIMKVITTLGDGGTIWIIIALILLFTKKYRKYGFMMAAGLIITLVVNDNILKPLIARPRPFDFEGWTDFIYPEIIKRPDGFSFPSGHTTSSFLSTVPLLKANKKFGIPALVLAALIAFSRVYVFVHYPTDILGGIVMGFIYGLLGCLIVDQIYKAIERRKMKKRMESKTEEATEETTVNA
ncbi:MAG TPA: phosphatase PAP2 family protein [Clostridiales bacterium]|jgi:undecaprenyl-diphosphatase|nr:phosphatase PAP2 family protein [Clostridiales bacterium]HOJ35429.1 phosphatase PAP2 family protein [Clostridiales bacterium]HOL79750.1 phosphatase PAP2 family protein [Clostridiales bacterium]HPP68937.1 phosphatase PAP2 family protein [Clostridiales bacterium]HPU66731.1 phosphatase PAP2 family protein [Clostridiales bacterium]